MSKDTASRVRALAWSTKMRGLQRGWRCGGGTGGWVWGLWKRGRLQWLASIDLLCAAILPPFATGVDHPLPPHPLVRRYRPLQPPTQPSTHLTPRGRGRHFEKWFRKSSWPGTSFFNRPFFFCLQQQPLLFFGTQPLRLQREEKASCGTLDAKRRQIETSRRQGNNKWRGSGQMAISRYVDIKFMTLSSLASIEHRWMDILVVPSTNRTVPFYYKLMCN